MTLHTNNLFLHSTLANVKNFRYTNKARLTMDIVGLLISLLVLAIIVTLSVGVWWLYRQHLDTTDQLERTTGIAQGAMVQGNRTQSFIKTGTVPAMKNSWPFLSVTSFTARNVAASNVNAQSFTANSGTVNSQLAVRGNATIGGNATINGRLDAQGLSARTTADLTADNNLLGGNSNKWMLHTPNRTANQGLFIAPVNNGTADWTKNLRILRNGDLEVNGTAVVRGANKRLCINNTCVTEADLQAILERNKIQGGEFYTRLNCNNGGAQARTVNVVFNPAFAAVPDVYVSIKMVDWCNVANTGMRAVANVRNITRTGATIELATWNNTQMYSLTGTWIAIPKAKK